MSSKPGAFLRNGFSDDELGVEEAANLQGASNACRIVNDCAHLCIGKSTRGINGHAVARVNSRPLDMLHNARDEYLVAVADGIDLDFCAFEIPINQNRMFPVVRDCVRNVAFQSVWCANYLHRSPAKDIGWAHYQRVANALCRFQRFRNGVDRASLGT